jgi:hypothetical protein
LYAPAVRELTERRTEFSRTYYNADGTFTAQISPRPIYFKAPDGSFQTINTALTATTRAGFVAANESNVLRAYLPGNAAGWVRVESGGTAMAFRPIGVASAAVTLADTRAGYANVAENVSLAYDVQPGRLKETLTLSAPVGKPVFSFDMKIEGATPNVTVDGTVDLVDEEGASAMTIEAPWMQDAGGDISTAIDVSLTKTVDGYTYTIAPDSEWLASARYPVVIDPSAGCNPAWISAAPDVPGSCYPTSSPESGHVAPDFAYRGGTHTSLCYQASILAVGGSGQGWRSVMNFGNLTSSALPYESDVDYAVLRLNALQSNGSLPVRIEAWDMPVVFSNTASYGSNAPTWTNLNTAWDPTTETKISYAHSPAVSISSIDFEDPEFDLDVTSIINAWVDNRVTTKQNIMLREADDASEFPNSTILFFEPYASVCLEITYRSGWYTFQGNSRRTGRTHIPVPFEATKIWGATVSVGVDKRLDQYLEPSVIAVPNPPNPSSQYPIVYAAVGYYDDIDNIGTKVARIQDTDTSYQTTTRDVEGIYATGTPLCVGNVLVVVGNTSLYSGVGCAVGLNATTLQPIWTRWFEGTVYSSPACYAGPVEYQDEQEEWHTHTGGAVLICANDQSLDPVALNDETTNTGVMFALNPANGNHVWGTVGAQGNYLGGLPYMVYNATYSSPSHNGELAYAQDHSCVVNARYLLRGDSAFGTSIDNQHEESTVSIFGHRLMWGSVRLGQFEWAAISSIEADGQNSPSLLRDNPWYALYDPTADLEAEPPDPGLSDVWGTLAFRSEDDAAFFGDDSGLVHGIGVDRDPNTARPYIKWELPTQICEAPVRCSAVVSASPGNGGLVFVGADDEYVHMLDASTGEEYCALGDGGYPLNGKVRGSLAAFRGRLYCVTAGRLDEDGDVIAQPTVYCFGYLDP